MPKNQDSLNTELFDFLQTRGYDITLLDTSGKEVPVPENAEVFQFEFTKDGKKYGKVTISIDGLNKLIIYFGEDVADSPKQDGHGDDSWYSLLKQLKRLAQRNQLSFKIKNVDRLKYDMAKRAHTKKLDEGYHPINKKASYNDSVPSTKIIIKHKRNMEEGEQRFRQIESIFVENIRGERFMLETTKPGLARVFARHIAEGGKVNDDRWNHLNSLCEEYGKMAGFVRATKTQQFNESAQPLIIEGVNHYNSLRETLHKLTGKRGYNQYFESWTPTLNEGEQDNSLSEVFMQSSLDPRIESVLPILSRLKQNVSETTDLKHVQELEEWADNIIEAEGAGYNAPHTLNPEPEFVHETDEAEKQRYEQGARDVVKGADPDHIARVRKLDPEILRKHVGYAWDKVNSGEYKLNRPDLKETKPKQDDLIGGYTQDQYDDMMARFKALVKKQQQEKAKKQEQPKQEKQVDETGPAGKPGDYFDATQQVSTGPVLGNKLQSQKGLRGKLVGESEDLLDKFKKLSGLK